MTVPLEGKVRHRDPDTSWNVASVDPGSWSSLQTAIVDILREHGPLTDEELHREYLAHAYETRSPQRIRTARKELEVAKIVRRADLVGRTRYGNRSIKWEVAA